MSSDGWDEFDKYIEGLRHEYHAYWVEEVEAGRKPMHYGAWLDDRYPLPPEEKKSPIINCLLGALLMLVRKFSR